MLKGDCYYGVQFAQSLYLMLWQSGRIHEIPERVFSSSEDVSVCYDGMEIALSQEAVCSFYRDMAEKTKQVGGFYRMDMPTTQFLELSPDGSYAVGHWTTMTRRLDGALPEGKLGLCIGQFTNEYVLENGIWKLKHVKWEQLWTAGSWDVTPDENLETYCREPKAWINEIPELTALSMEGVTPKTMEILVLRNEIYSWFYRFNIRRDVKWGEKCLFSEDRKRVEDMIKDCRCVLVTSPVIHMKDDLSCGEAFYSITGIKEDAAGALAYMRGAMHLQMLKEEAGWQIQRFGCYPYATLDPW